MLFSSVTFLYYFIPCVLLVYFAVPRHLKNAVLLLFSIFFYAWGEPKYVVLMLFSAAQGYVFGRLIEKNLHTRRSKLYLTASAAFSLTVLFFFKYADFLLLNVGRATGRHIPFLKLPLPIGISFYTFQALSYVADVYMERTKAQKSFINFAAYLSMFPQLIAGPIVRYSDICGQLENRVHSIAGAAAGIRRFVMGLSKKVLLANVLGELAGLVRQSDDKSVLLFWLYAVSCTLQIYFDFSGYSDMAIGLGLIFGFRFPENFNYPFISDSITEFWRRWHMTLGAWFRDYLYIPLGGNRVSTLKWLRNMCLVWMATGLWHGAAWNFVLWGVFFAALLIAEKLWLGKRLKKRRLLKHIYVLLMVTVSFVIFNAQNISDAFFCIRTMLFAAQLPPVSVTGVYYFKSYAFVLLLAMLFATPLPADMVGALKKHRAGQAVFSVLEPVCIVFFLMLCTAFLIDGSFNPFLYFRF